MKAKLFFLLSLILLGASGAVSARDFVQVQVGPVVLTQASGGYASNRERSWVAPSGYVRSWDSAPYYSYPLVRTYDPYVVVARPLPPPVYNSYDGYHRGYRDWDDRRSHRNFYHHDQYDRGDDYGRHYDHWR